MTRDISVLHKKYFLHHVVTYYILLL